MKRILFPTIGRTMWAALSLALVNCALGEGGSNSSTIRGDAGQMDSSVGGSSSGVASASSSGIGGIESGTGDDGGGTLPGSDSGIALDGVGSVDDGSGA